MTKWVFRRKEDGYVVVYSDREPKGKKHAEELMKSKDFELLSVVEAEASVPKAFKEVPIIEDTLECPLCGKVVADDAALLEHKKKDHDAPKRGRPKKT